MANLFKTGQELKQERMADLSASNIKIARAGGRDNREKANRGLGAALGTALVGAFEEDKIGAGDVIKQFDIETPEGAAQAAAQLAKMGMVEASDNMLARVKTMQSIIKEGGGGKDKKPEVSALDIKAVGSAIGALGNDENSQLGSVVAPFFAEDAKGYQKAQASVLVNSIAEQAASVEARLLKDGIPAVTRPMIIQSIVNGMDNTKGIITPDSKFLFWGKEGGVNSKAMNKEVSRLGNAEYSKWKKMNTTASKPVEVAKEGQTGRTTGEDNVYDEDGSWGVPAKTIAEMTKEIMASDKPQAEKVKEIEYLAKEKAAAIKKPTPTDLSQIKPDSTEMSSRINKLFGTNPYAVDTESSIEVIPRDKKQLKKQQQKQVLDGLKSGELNSNDPEVQALIKELFKK